MVVLSLALVIKRIGMPHEPAYLGGLFASILCGLAVGWRSARTRPGQFAAVLGTLIGVITWTATLGLVVHAFIDRSTDTLLVPDALGLKLGLAICGLLALSVLYLVVQAVSARRTRKRTITAERLPGSTFLAWAEVIFSAKTVTYVIRPLIADTQKEFLDALHESEEERHNGKNDNRKILKATFVRVRWPLHLVKAFTMQTIASLAATVMRIARFR